METRDAVQRLKTAVSEGKLQDLMRGGWAEVLPRARNACLRLIMEIPADACEKNAIAWAEVKPALEALDEPVSAEAVEAWLPGAPERAVPFFARSLHLDEPEPLTVEGFLSMVEAHRPALYERCIQPHLDASQRARELAAAHAKPIVAALLRRDNPGNGSTALDQLPDEALGPFLEGLAEQGVEPSSYTVRSLRRGAPHAPAAYAALAAVAVKKTKKREVNGLFIELAPLDADGIETILSGVKGKEAHFQRVAFLCAYAATEAAAEALARFLDHKKRGRLAARWLAVMGPTGRKAAAAAAEAVAKKKTQAAERVRENAAKVAALPPASSLLPALGNKPSGWNLDPERFALDLEDLEAPTGEPPHPPIALEDAERVLKDAKHDPADLKPHEWADLLQIVTIKGFAQDLGWAHERARVRGLLGWGAQEHRLAEALERFDFDGHYKIGWGQDGRLGLMHFLLGCEASEDVLLHAYALYGRRRGNLMAGCVPRNFDEPLKAFGHAKQTALLLLARHLEIRKYNVIGADEILRYPVLEEASGLEGSWTSAEPRRDVRIRVSVTGASKATITLRGGIRVTLDGSERRWSIEGLPGSASGPTSLLGDERVLQLDVEAVGPVLRLGFNGTIGGEMPQGYLFEGVGTEASPIEVETDGAIQRVRVTEMRSQRAATDLARLVGFEEEGAVRDVAEGGDAAAALALAAEASLGDDEGVAAAAKAALQELGEVGAPWREALGLDAVEAEEKVFPLRSFDACVAAFAALKDGEPKQVEGVDGYAKTVAWKSPASPDWSDDGIAEDTLYLVEGDDWRGEGVSDAKTLMGSSIPALTTWNSRGSGDWAGEPGTWMILTCDDLMQEQDEWGNWMSVTLAAWKVEEGVAVAAWKGKREDLAKVMGLPDGWPSRRSWTSIPVWIGE